MSTPQEEAALAGRMAHEMIKAMAPHRDRGHWREASIGYLIERLAEEVNELADEVTGMRYNVWKEAADIANFAAMIADKCDPMEGAT